VTDIHNSALPATSEPYQMTDLEKSTGLVLGLDRPKRNRRSHTILDPIEALEGAIMPALLRPPCLVSFSGGLDSSLILSVALNLARREGLPEPIPATYRVLGATSGDEAEWQDSVAQELGVADSIVLTFTNELDVVGPFAIDVLRRHGVVFPFNAHGHLPLIREARGGSILTGAGGDELFSLPSRARTVWVVRGRAPLGRRDPLRIAFAGLPASLRTPFIRRRFPVSFRWLTERANDRFKREWAAAAARQPARWDTSRRWLLRRRYLRILQETLALIGGDEGTSIHNPYLHPAVVESVAGAGGPLGWRTRNEAIAALFDSLVPTSVSGRTSKASGNEMFFSDHSKAFVARWDGQGINPDLVDAARLRQEWASSNPDPHTLSLIQTTWLASHDISLKRSFGTDGSR
jgi:Asparagine synthase